MIKRSLNPFHKRVNLERRVLHRINGSLIKCCPLVGLTTEAIEIWGIDAKLMYDSTKIGEIVVFITQISFISKLSADCSKDVLSDDKFTSVRSIDELIGRLDDALKQFADII